MSLFSTPVTTRTVLNNMINTKTVETKVIKLSMDNSFDYAL